MQLLNRLLHRQPYSPLNQLIISKQKLGQNLAYLQTINPAIKIAPVLKSNAYGHGLVQTAKILDDKDCPFLCVDNLYEAYELYKNHVKTPILILGFVDPENLKVKKLPFSFVVYDRTMLEVLDRYQPGAKIHIKVDTGMHRLGVPLDELPQFLDDLAHSPNIEVEGFMSHFADADNASSKNNQLQIDRFKQAIQILRDHHLQPKWIHIQNSAGLLNLDVPEVNLARTGLALYGISPTDKLDKNLQPVAKLVSKIVQIKQLSKGDFVGYGATFIAKSTMTIGVVPLGYYEGLDRRLSNLGGVQLDGKVCPIIGAISMNMSTVDLSQVKNPQIGQEVIVFSDNATDENAFASAAKIGNTIPYDLLVHLPPTIKRVYD